MKAKAALASEYKSKFVGCCDETSVIDKIQMVC